MAVKINTDDYLEYGLGDIYYGMISFIGKYVNENYDPLEVFELPNGYQSKYALAMDTMKVSLKELLDYFKLHDEIYLPNVGRKIRISNLNIEDQKDLEECCKDFMLMNLEAVKELSKKGLKK